MTQLAEFTLKKYYLIVDGRQKYGIIHNIRLYDLL
jgi:hypothetical protein